MRTTGLSALAVLALCLQSTLLSAQIRIEGQYSETVEDQGESQYPLLEKPAQVTYDAYILGPGDVLEIELLDLPELSGMFSIGPDGTIYMPRLRALYAEGLTVEEPRELLTTQFKTHVRNPQISSAQSCTGQFAYMLVVK